MQENTVLSLERDEFMKKFKYYKSNKTKPSIDDVISTQICTDEVIKIPQHIMVDDPRTEILGLKSFKEWQLSTFSRHSGLFFIRNPFTDSGQRYWIRKCLEVYPRKPNKLNIDIDRNIPDWWAECFKHNSCDKVLLKKLRWTTLGYHHNWDTKVYSEDNKTPFPEDLAELSDVLAKYLSYDNFKAQAAIINYYHMNSTLSAHTDHSEVNLEAPLFSFSFGQSAIFLIGGKERSVAPSAILINSGDIVVMSKEARLCYHAVPKILPAPSSCWNKPEVLHINKRILDFKYISEPEAIMSMMKQNVDNEEWSRFEDYIQQSRINMNVRQVLNEKQNSL